MMNADTFYDDLAPFYHLIYPDWEKSVARQGGQLHSVIQKTWPGAETVLDVSCGIGTQALGLAQSGYHVTASDLSRKEIERARRESDRLGLKVNYSVADMRDVSSCHEAQFDVVISCDNSIPHLLSDDEIRTAFKQFYQCTRPGGGSLITVRDYEKEDLSEQQIKLYGIREDQDSRWLVWQVWDPEPLTYNVTMYMIEDRGESKCETHVVRSRYYAIRIPRLIELMTEAGFERVCRLDDVFFQPMLIGYKS